MVRTYNGRNARGKGSDRSGKNSSKDTTTETKMQTVEFTAHIAGKHQPVTYDTVVEHILQDIQKDLKHGSDMAVNLRNGADAGIPIPKPRRQRAKKPKTVVKAETKTEKREDDSSETFGDPIGEIREDPSDDSDDTDPEEEMRLEQQDFDMEYTIDLKEWKARTNTYAENKFKAYTIIFEYCNNTM
jgi:hypothetical protein